MADEAGPYRRILFATDFSESSRHAARYAALLARRLSARLEIVHVLTPHGGDPAMAEAEMAHVVAAGDAELVDARHCVRALSAELGILEAAKDGQADLVVLGTHGRGGLRHVLLGSVAERVVQLADVPVLTVRQPDHTFEHPGAAGA